MENNSYFVLVLLHLLDSAQEVHKNERWYLETFCNSFDVALEELFQAIPMIALDDTLAKNLPEGHLRKALAKLMQLLQRLHELVVVIGAMDDTFAMFVAPRESDDWGPTASTLPSEHLANIRFEDYFSVPVGRRVYVAEVLEDHDIPAITSQLHSSLETLRQQAMELAPLCVEDGDIAAATVPATLVPAGALQNQQLQEYVMWEHRDMHRCFSDVRSVIYAAVASVHYAANNLLPYIHQMSQDANHAVLCVCEQLSAVMRLLGDDSLWLANGHSRADSTLADFRRRWSGSLDPSEQRSFDMIWTAHMGPDLQPGILRIMLL